MSLLSNKLVHLDDVVAIDLVHIRRAVLKQRIDGGVLREFLSV